MILYRADRERLEADTSLEEIQTAIGSLQAGKTLGLGTLPTEFYSTFAEIVAPKLTDLFSELSSLAALPESMQKADIVLIPTLGINTQEWASYRPISLLNVDAKLLSKVLAIRLSTVLEDLIHIDQTWFMTGKGTDINLDDNKRECGAYYINN